MSCASLCSPQPLARVCRQRSRTADGLEATQEHWPGLRTASLERLSPLPLSSPPLRSPSRTGRWGNRDLKKGEHLRRWGLALGGRVRKGLKVSFTRSGEDRREKEGELKALEAALPCSHL